MFNRKTVPPGGPIWPAQPKPKKKKRKKGRPTK